jgi:hypothetical protein
MANENLNDIKIYPNPSQNFLKINVDSIINGEQITISDLSGKVVLQKKAEVNLNEYTVDIRDIKTGIYLLTFKSSHTTWTKRIIKK